MTWTFAQFVPGAEMGEASFVIEQPMIDAWLGLFPQDRAYLPRLPAGFVSVVTMRAYASVITPRPPGNIHGQQEFDVRAMPPVGGRIETRVSCVDKEIKRDRRWVTFATESRGAASELLFSGRMSIVWAS